MDRPAPVSTVKQPGLRRSAASAREVTVSNVDARRRWWNRGASAGSARPVGGAHQVRQRCPVCPRALAGYAHDACRRCPPRLPRPPRPSCPPRPATVPGMILMPSRQKSESAHLGLVQRLRLGTLFRRGSVSERPMVQHSKCCVVRATVGSNPTATANWAVGNPLPIEPAPAVSRGGPPRGRRARAVTCAGLHWHSHAPGYTGSHMRRVTWNGCQQCPRCGYPGAHGFPCQICPDDDACGSGGFC